MDGGPTEDKNDGYSPDYKDKSLNYSHRGAPITRREIWMRKMRNRRCECSGLTSLASMAMKAGEKRPPPCYVPADGTGAARYPARTSARPASMAAECRLNEIG